MERLELTVQQTREDPRRLAVAVGTNIRDELSQRGNQVQTGDRADLAVTVSSTSTANEIATAVVDQLIAAPEAT